MSEPVVVGVDGSADASRAVRWAATEAAYRETWLDVVHAWLWPLYRVQLDAAPGMPEGSGLRGQAERTLADASEVATSVAPGLHVRTTLVTGDPGAQLVSLSRQAQLVVVGHRGLGGFSELILGSVGAALTAHAACPVAIVRGASRPAAPVVVGVESVQDSETEVRTAFQEAAYRSVPVTAVHCYRVPVPDDGTPSSVPHVPYHERVRAAEEDALRVVRDAVEVARKDFPDVPLHIALGERSPAVELVHASRSAGLVVVGARGGGGFAELLLGSTARALVHHADAPVLVLRHRAG